MRPLAPWHCTSTTHNTIQNQVAKFKFNPGGESFKIKNREYMSLRYVMEICHEDMSCMYQMCHACTRYVIGYVMQVCHVDAYVMVVYHGDFR